VPVPFPTAVSSDGAQPAVGDSDAFTVSLDRDDLDDPLVQRLTAQAFSCECAAELEASAAIVDAIALASQRNVDLGIQLACGRATRGFALELVASDLKRLLSAFHSLVVEETPAELVETAPQIAIDAGALPWDQVCDSGGAPVSPIDPELDQPPWKLHIVLSHPLQKHASDKLFRAHFVPMAWWGVQAQLYAIIARANTALAAMGSNASIVCPQVSASFSVDDAPSLDNHDDLLRHNSNSFLSLRSRAAGAEMIPLCASHGRLVTVDLVSLTRMLERTCQSVWSFSFPGGSFSIRRIKLVHQALLPWHAPTRFSSSRPSGKCWVPIGCTAWQHAELLLSNCYHVTAGIMKGPGFTIQARVVRSKVAVKASDAGAARSMIMVVTIGVGYAVPEFNCAAANAAALLSVLHATDSYRLFSSALKSVADSAKSRVSAEALRSIGAMQESFKSAGAAVSSSSKRRKRQRSCSGGR
jgi:hypothetical protein